MVMSRERSRQRYWGGWLTALSYLCAFALALVLCRGFAPGGRWHRNGPGLRRERRPYLVLELPVAWEDTALGPLAGTGEELPSPHRQLIRRHGPDLWEYTQWLRRYPWEGEHLEVRQWGDSYEVYFVPATPGTTRVPVPVGYDYTLSGDGESGFIVTVSK